MGAGILLSWAASESEPVKSSFQSIIKYACEAAYSPRSTPFMHERRNNGPRNTIPFCFIVQKCKSDDADDTWTIRDASLFLFLSICEKEEKEEEEEEEIVSYGNK